MAEKAVSSYSYEAYLELEKNHEPKYEFHDGMITAMVGGTPNHALITSNVGIAIGIELRKKGKPCTIYSSDAKIRIEASNRTFYPDASIICGKAQTAQKDPNALTNPILIVEVLSDSTADFHRGLKFGHYRQLTSLRQYVLVSQSEALVDTYFRTEDGTWEIQTLSNLEDMVLLKAIDCQISMKDLYYRVEEIQSDDR